MSTWCEIVRYRANMKAVLALTYVKSLQGPEKLFKRSEKQSTPKTLLRYSKFDPLNCPVDGVHSKRFKGFKPFKVLAHEQFTNGR
jgi:hypothetical protein